MTDAAALLLRQLIIINEASSAAIELLGGIPTGGYSAPNEPAPCPHPGNQREDLSSLGDEPGSHWSCNACGHEHHAPMEGEPDAS